MRGAPSRSARSLNGPWSDFKLLQPCPTIPTGRALVLRSLSVGLSDIAVLRDRTLAPSPTGDITQPGPHRPSRSAAKANVKPDPKGPTAPQGTVGTDGSSLLNRRRTMAARKNQAPARPKHLGVFVTEQFEGSDGEERTNYVRVGTAFPHKQGCGFNVEITEGISIGGKACRTAPAGTRGVEQPGSPACRAVTGKGTSNGPFSFGAPTARPQSRIPLLTRTAHKRLSKYRWKTSFSGHAASSTQNAPIRPTSPAIQSAACTV